MPLVGQRQDSIRGDRLPSDSADAPVTEIVRAWPGRFVDRAGPRPGADRG